VNAPLPGQRAGRVMLILCWLAALLLATWFFGAFEEKRENPNQNPASQRYENAIEVVLQSGRDGHYRMGGKINGEKVRLMLDTGATSVAIPVTVAKRLGLRSGAGIPVRTANGTVTAHLTRLASLQLGEIELYDVEALISPGMEGEEILLGMSALRQLEFTHKDGRLLLRQYLP